MEPKASSFDVKVFAVAVGVVVGGIVIMILSGEDPFKGSPPADPTKPAIVKQQQDERKNKAEAEINARFYSYVPIGRTVRLDQNGNDLDIYLSLNDFQSIPFPDRKNFVETVGRLWCDSSPNDSFLPSLKIYDIRTGNKLGGYGCTLGWVSLP